MKLHGLFLLWLLFVGARPAAIDYTTIDDGTCRFSFPVSYQTNIEGDVAMYSKEVGDITFDVHRFFTGSVLVSSSTAAPASVATPNQQSQLFVQMLQQATGAQIISQSAVTKNGREGTEVEVNYPEPGTDQTTKMYVQYFWNGRRMYAFSVASSLNNSAALADARTTLFNSISFY